MHHGTTRHLIASVIEAYAIPLNGLADSIYDLLSAIRCTVTQIIAILVSPIVFLSITFYAIVTALMGVTSRQAFPHYSASSTHTSPTPHSVDSDSSIMPADSRSTIHGTSPTPQSVGSFNPRLALPLQDIGQLDGSLRALPEGGMMSATLVRAEDQLHIIPGAPPPENPLPAIPAHLKECEFYNNPADMDLEENLELLQGSVRLTVDEECRSSAPAVAKTFLEGLERMRLLGIKETGGIELSEGKRGTLELRRRVYAGPVEWLLRVLVDETGP